MSCINMRVLSVTPSLLTVLSLLSSAITKCNFQLCLFLTYDILESVAALPAPVCPLQPVLGSPLI